MREKVEAKLKEATEQVAQWQQRLAQAQEQCIRWDAIRLVCGELLVLSPVEVLAGDVTDGD